MRARVPCVIDESRPSLCFFLGRRRGTEGGLSGDRAQTKNQKERERANERRRGDAVEKGGKNQNTAHRGAQRERAPLAPVPLASLFYNQTKFCDRVPRHFEGE